MLSSLKAHLLNDTYERSAACCHGIKTHGLDEQEGPSYVDSADKCNAIMEAQEESYVMQSYV
jgi:hypothetical protein